MIEMKDKNEIGDSDNTFSLLLLRMKKFHGFLLVCIGGAFIYYLQSAIMQALTHSKFNGPTSESDYMLVGILPAMLAAWVVFSWWAWIRRDDESVTNSTHARSASTNLSHQRSQTNLHLKNAQPVSPVSTRHSSRPETLEKEGSREDLGLGENEGENERKSRDVSPTNLEKGIHHQEEEQLISGPRRSHEAGLTPSATMDLSGRVEMTERGGNSASGSSEISVDGSVGVRGKVVLQDDILENPRKIFNPYLSADVVLEEGNKESEE